MRSSVYTGTDAFPALAGLLSGINGKKIFILTGTHTRQFCLPVLLDKIRFSGEPEIIEVEVGEENKNIDTVRLIWEHLLQAGAGRDSILICLGGGVITDMGGFAASTYRRGIRCISIPTTLIGMADAAIGGKTGVNLGNIKNQAGTFALPEAVFIDPVFLSTLPGEHLMSGFGEIIKYGLIGLPEIWKEITRLHTKPLSPEKIAGWIPACAAFKCGLVNEDFQEKGRRIILNFGHTAGHALESLSLKRGKPVTHGHAVALGMICESFISVKLSIMDPALSEGISRVILSYFDVFTFDYGDIDFLMEMVFADKKTAGNLLQLPLLIRPGEMDTSIKCEPDLMRESFLYYLHVIK